MTTPNEAAQAAYEKHQKGETLTPADEEALLQYDADGPPKNKEFEDEDAAATEEALKKEAEDKAAADKKAADEKAAADAKNSDTQTEAEKAESAKNARKEGETSAPAQTADEMKRIEQELEKPAGSENLDGFTSSMKGLFYDLKSTRKRAQEAEQKARSLEFELKKKELAEKEAKEKGEEGDQDLFVSKKELREELAKAREEGVRYRIQTDLQLDFERTKARNLEDFDLAMTAADELFKDDKAFGSQMQEAILSMPRGGSPAKLAYELVVKDARFAAYKAKHQKAPEKKETEDERIKREEAEQARKNAETNKNKAVTTSHAGGEGGGADASDWTLEQIGKLTDEQFKKLKPNVQDAILKKLEG